MVGVWVVSCFDAAVEKAEAGVLVKAEKAFVGYSDVVEPQVD